MKMRITLKRHDDGGRIWVDTGDGRDVFLSQKSLQRAGLIGHTLGEVIDLDVGAIELLQCANATIVKP